MSDARQGLSKSSVKEGIRTLLKSEDLENYQKGRLKLTNPAIRNTQACHFMTELIV